MIPYCGTPPVPGGLLERWNLDPVLLRVLAILALGQILRTKALRRPSATAGWLVATLAFVSPLCPLSVALFSARVAQHMLLILIAAPLIATSLPRPARNSTWASALAFCAALWLWHMPAPYDATFRSTPLYWAMHVSLFGTAIWLWRDLLRHPRSQTFQALGAGLATSVAMGLLGAVLSLSSHPWFAWHLATTGAWGFTPLDDQQLGGSIMWVPSIAWFLWASTRSLLLFAGLLEERPA